MRPLSLEQVLARSMRLPRQRARHQVSALFSSSQAGAGEVTYRSHPPPPPPADGQPRPQSAFSRRTPQSPRQRAQRLSFFELMDAQDAQRSAGHLRIHSAPSAALTKNSTDLLSFLVTAQRMGDWQDALRAFLRATETRLEDVAPGSPAADAHAAHDGGAGSHHVRLVQARSVSTPPRASSLLNSASGNATGVVSTTAPSESMLVNPTAAHITAVIDACAEDDQWAVVAALTRFYGEAFPALLTHSTTRIVNACDPQDPRSSSAPSSSSSSVKPSSLTRWQRGLQFLTDDLALQPSLIPVEAFNVCLAACEAEKDWTGALAVIRQMGPNPLQSVTLEGEVATTASTADTDAAALRGPAPDVVSYATLIATLEQSGKSALVPHVLNCLPPVEREEITASYAALIYVWSNQVYSKHNRRF